MLTFGVFIAGFGLGGLGFLAWVMADLIDFWDKADEE
jgi:hypothetical protein